MFLGSFLRRFFRDFIFYDFGFYKVFYVSYLFYSLKGMEDTIPALFLRLEIGKVPKTFIFCLYYVIFCKKCVLSRPFVFKLKNNARVPHIVVSILENGSRAIFYKFFLEKCSLQVHIQFYGTQEDKY